MLDSVEVAALVAEVQVDTVLDSDVVEQTTGYQFFNTRMLAPNVWEVPVQSILLCRRPQKCSTRPISAKRTMICVARET